MFRGEVHGRRLGAVPFGIEVLDGFPIESSGPEVVIEVGAIEWSAVLGIHLHRPGAVGCRAPVAIDA